MKLLAGKRFLLALLLSFMLCTSGCVYLIVGGIGALGGYVVSPDTVEGITAHDQDEVWDAANEVLSIMGTISEAKQASGLMIARVSGAKITVTVVSVNKTSTKLNIKARKGPFPKITIAQDIYTKIITHLTE